MTLDRQSVVGLWFIVTPLSLSYWNVRNTESSRRAIKPLMHSHAVDQMTASMAHWNWEPERDVRLLLRPSEHLLLVFDGSYLTHDRERHSKALPSNSSDTRLESPSVESRVILAIIGHTNPNMEESGSVFLYTADEATSNATYDSPLVLQRTFPIHGKFSFEISQLASSSAADLLDSYPDIMPPSWPTDSRFLLQLSEGKSTYAIVTDDMECLSSFASICRRLRGSAAKTSYDGLSYQWLEPYDLHPSSWLSVNPPRDLRHARKTVHLSLSPGCAGQPVNDVADYAVIRDDWLWSRSLATVRRDSEKKQLRIRIGTFNVNGKLPSQDLSTWLGVVPRSGGYNNEQKHVIHSLRESPFAPRDKDTSHRGTGEASPLYGFHIVAYSFAFAEIEGTAPAPDPDMLVMAFQEADLSTEAFLYFTGPAREDAWTAAILAALGERAEQYEKLVSKQLVGILLIAFVKTELRSCFTEIMEGSVAAGFMGVMGNKGAVAIRLNYRPDPTSSAPSPVPISFTFVNSHLAAFDDHIERRNVDFHDIERRIEFGPCIEYVWAPRTRDRVGPQTLNMYGTDVLFWMGDLNYRLNLPDADVRHLLCSVPSSQGIHTLLQFDELKSSIRHSKAFTGFKEHPITFLPTYRFAATVQTDVVGYDIKRKPAWTDRVLHKSSPFVPVSQTSYDAHPSITMSDHRPVSAEFLVDLPCIDSRALDLAANDLYNCIATFDPENPSGIPILKLDKLELDFGKVLYSTPVSQSLSILNTGKVPTAFRFFPRDLTSPIHPRWLKVEPLAGFLLPGEEKTLRLTIFVSPTIAGPLNLRKQKLSTSLILHAIFGQDFFLSVSGEYEPTCFGTPLSALARLPCPIRELRRPEDLLPERQVGKHSSREFMKLMGWLTTHDVEAVPDLFVAPGDEDLAMQMRESLDMGAELPPYPAPMTPQTVDANYAHTVAAVLLAFLRSLPEPVIPFSLHQRCAEVTSKDAALEMLSVFPPSSVNVWISMTAFLHLLTLRDHHQAEVPDERPSSLVEDVQPLNPPSRAEILASIFAPVMLRDDIDAASPVTLLGKKRFLLFFMRGL